MIPHQDSKRSCPGGMRKRGVTTPHRKQLAFSICVIILSLDTLLLARHQLIFVIIFRQIFEVAPYFEVKII